MYLVFIYTIAYILREARHLYYEDASAYFNQWQNRLEAVSYVFYLGYCVTATITFYNKLSAAAVLRDRTVWPDLVLGDEKLGQLFYYLIADRSYWAPDDPLFVSD